MPNPPPPLKDPHRQRRAHDALTLIALGPCSQAAIQPLDIVCLTCGHYRAAARAGKESGTAGWRD
jgi:ribosomal protein L32